jgi:hypothetical protein
LIAKNRFIGQGSMRRERARYRGLGAPKPSRLGPIGIEIEVVRRRDDQVSHRKFVLQFDKCGYFTESKGAK